MSGFGLVHAEENHYKLLKLDGHVVKWGDPTLGSPAHVTYAFATAAFHDPEARNCGDIAPLKSVAQRSGLSEDDIRQQAAAAAALWSSVAGITFEEVSDPAKANILIGEQSEPTGYAFANVEYRKPVLAKDAKRSGDRALNIPDGRANLGREPNAQSVATISRSMICLNPERIWKSGFGGNASAYDIRYTFTHELGHAIGLDHYYHAGFLMYYKYTEAFRAPQSGDIDGARALYGPPIAR
ncbi:matrixin family metalloprotease [Rhizobium sp. PAMB 3174]